jgi:DNA-binding transcriptional regulator YdaS (Cro superfamily)
LFGYGHVKKASIALGCHRVTVSQWLSGARPIPGTVIASLKLAMLLHPDERPKEWKP